MKLIFLKKSNWLVFLVIAVVIIVVFLIVFKRPIIISYSRSQWSHSSYTAYICANGTVFSHVDGGYVTKGKTTWYKGRISESEMKKLRNELGSSFNYSDVTRNPNALDTDEDVRLVYKNGRPSRVISADEYYHLDNLVYTTTKKASLSNKINEAEEVDEKKRVLWVDCFAH